MTEKYKEHSICSGYSLVSPEKIKNFVASSKKEIASSLSRKYSSGFPEVTSFS